MEQATPQPAQIRFVLSAPQCESRCEHPKKEDCRFQVRWAINPHMKIDSVNPVVARGQHRRLRRAMKELGAKLLQLPFVHGAHDSVFMKDNALLRETELGPQAFLAMPKYEMRQKEILSRAEALEKIGFMIRKVSEANFEGGDLVNFSRSTKAYLGHGFRSEACAAQDVSDFLEKEVIPLELIDPFFYHLDTALAFTEDNEGRLTAFVYPEAFSKDSLTQLKQDPSIHRLVYVSRNEAMAFGLNWIELPKAIILGSEVPGILESLEKIGKKAVVVPLDQFQLAGGSAACLTTQVH